MPRRILALLLAGGMMLGVSLAGYARESRLEIQADQATVGMGRTVVVTAALQDGAGTPLANQLVRPYVNGLRWGSEERTDASGGAQFSIPLPNPGECTIQLESVLALTPSRARWIWAAEPADRQTLYFVHPFEVQGEVQSATLHITCDDSYEAFLNGRPLSQGQNFQQVQKVAGLEKQLVQGTNHLAIQSTNATGPAGLLVQMDIEQPSHTWSLTSDGSWKYFSEAPTGWPGEIAAGGQPVTALAAVGGGIWGGYNLDWPGLTADGPFAVGKPLPTGDAVRPGAILSNILKVTVTPRTIEMPIDAGHLVGIEWEPWFTPLNIRWQTAQGQPVVGYYDSYNRDVIRQHCIWMAEAGINFLVVDWTNNLWGKQSWEERNPDVDELIEATRITLETYAQLSKEGIPVPVLCLLPGLDNGPHTTMKAINEQLRWVYENLVKPEEFRPLWLEHFGKPLIIVFNGGGPRVRENQEPVDESLFTVRWMSSQMQATRLHEKGYWSWMDGVSDPLPAYFDGKAEALTVTPAFFGDGGWLYPQARGRRGGATFMETFKTALRERPRFLLINQWNEFAGQPEGGGYGPKKDIFLDCYNIPFSNDIEPVSVSSEAYRSKGGYGYFYLNLMRALIGLYHEKQPESTLVALANPEDDAEINSSEIEVSWTYIGKEPQSWSLFLDGRELVKETQSSSAKVSLEALPPGSHELKLVAHGTRTRFLLSRIREDIPLEQPVEASATKIIQVAR